MTDNVQLPDYQNDAEADADFEMGRPRVGAESDDDRYADEVARKVIAGELPMQIMTPSVAWSNKNTETGESETKFLFGDAYAVSPDGLYVQFLFKKDNAGVDPETAVVVSKDELGI